MILELSEPRLYRTNLHISLEGNFKVGLTTIMENLSQIPWLAKNNYYSQNTDTLTSLNLTPNGILSGIPEADRWTTFYPEGIWELMARRERQNVDNVTERSDHSVFHIEWPYWHLAFLNFDVPNFVAPPTAPYMNPNVIGYPDVMIYVVSCPQRIAPRSTLSPRGIRRVGFVHERLEKIFQDCPNPKFRVNASRRTSTEVTSTVVDVLSVVRRLNMGYDE